MAHAPKPMGVINKSEFPSRFVFISMFRTGVVVSAWLTLCVTAASLPLRVRYIYF
jgi:hypothetical protein